LYFLLTLPTRFCTICIDVEGKEIKQETVMKIRTATATIGQNAKGPRIYIQGKYLAQAGFEAGTTYQVNDASGSLIIVPAEDGRKVSSKKNGEIPVIDINSSVITKALGAADKIEIITSLGEIKIVRAHVEARAARREKTNTAVALFAGGGMLCQAAKDAGFETVAAVEVSGDYADIWQSNHEGHMINQPIQEVDFNRLAAELDQPLGLMTIGIPCTPFSTARRSTKGNNTAPMEAHELGDMFFWALTAVQALNPYTVVIENVPGFQKSVAGIITTQVLSRLGYTIDEKIVEGQEFGEVSSRKRIVVVATMDEKVVWPEEKSLKQNLGSFLHDADDERCEWFTEETKPWLFAHWAKQSAKGNGFVSKVLTEDTEVCPTIKKRYFAQQGDNPVVAHPTKEGTFRWLTVDEVKMIMGLPEAYDLGTTKSKAGEILGQGVVVGLFSQIIEAAA
jgi:DNA (cytosine-5)-methyltransferase 1